VAIPRTRRNSGTRPSEALDRGDPQELVVDLGLLLVPGRGRGGQFAGGGRMRRPETRAPQVSGKFDPALTVGKE